MSVAFKPVETPHGEVGATRSYTWMAGNSVDRPFIHGLAGGRPRSTGGSCRD